MAFAMLQSSWLASGAIRPDARKSRFRSRRGRYALSLNERHSSVLYLRRGRQEPMHVGPDCQSAAPRQISGAGLQRPV